MVLPVNKALCIHYTKDRNSPITISYFNNLFPQKNVSEAAQSKHDDFDPLSGINSHKQQMVTFLRLFQEGSLDICLSLESLDSCLVLLSHTHLNSHILGRFIPTRLEPNNYLLNVKTSK